MAPFLPDRPGVRKFVTLIALGVLAVVGMAVFLCATCAVFQPSIGTSTEKGKSTDPRNP
jgi:hypothetical protein